MKNTIAKTTRPNGVSVTLSSDISLVPGGTVTYIVKSSRGHDVRFFETYNGAADRYNEIVKEENAKCSFPDSVDQVNYLGGR